MILKIALFGTLLSVGFGTYNGLIFVFLKSNPTIDVPRGTMTPPSTELNLYKILFGSVKSKLLPKSKPKILAVKNEKKNKCNFA